MTYIQNFSVSLSENNVKQESMLKYIVQCISPMTNLSSNHTTAENYVNIRNKDSLFEKF